MTSHSERPKPPRSEYPGFSWVPVVDEQWQVGGEGRPCRWQTGGVTRPCGSDAVAVLLRPYRGKKARKWGYCAAHMYGRWVEDGKVMHYVLREEGASE